MSGIIYVLAGIMQKKMKKLWNYFSTYEKIWYFSILVLAIIFAFIFPEEDTNGVNGKVIMACYLADIILNVSCELLISKQSKWNFIVSLGVEAAEIAVCVVCAYRWTTCATTIFFWIPIDIISFINWNKHKDTSDEDLTVVRKLTLKQDILVGLGVAAFTVIFGFASCYFTENILVSDFFAGHRDIEMIVCYMDACASALGIANGVFIWLRYKEQWFAWYAVAILETVMNILSGQYVLLILKLGYLTNTTYGYIRWSRYIKEHEGKALEA